MNRFTQGVGLVAKVVLVGSSVALLGAACWKGVGTNTNVGVGNGNAVANENTNIVVGNMNAEVSANVNADVNTNSTGEIDTSDWLTYTNEEYGFSVQYPKSWIIQEEEGIFSSKEVDGAKIIAIYATNEGVQTFSMYPEGEFDSDRFINSIETNIVLAGVSAKKFTLKNSAAILLTDYPISNPGKFRIETFFVNESDKNILDEVLNSFQI